MSHLRQILLQHIAAELGSLFPTLLEDYLAAKYEACQAYSEAHLDRALHARANGSLQQLHILQEVVRAAQKANLPAEMAPTSPRGHHYAKITLERFVLGGMRLESSHWSSAKYAKSLAQLNTALEPVNSDLFATVSDGQPGERIFVVVAVAENPLNHGPEIIFAVPFSSRQGFHFSFTLEEERQAALTPAQADALEPLPVLKKRLDEAEPQTKQA